MKRARVHSPGAEHRPGRGAERRRPVKPFRKIERALRRAEGTLDRLEAFYRRKRLTPEAFLESTPAIRDYLAVVDRELAHNAEATRAYATDYQRVLERTRSLAGALGLGALWDETVGRADR